MGKLDWVGWFVRSLFLDTNVRLPSADPFLRMRRKKKRGTKKSTLHMYILTYIRRGHEGRRCRRYNRRRVLLTAIDRFCFFVLGLCWGKKNCCRPQQQQQQQPNRGTDRRLEFRSISAKQSKAKPKPKETPNPVFFVAPRP